MKKISVVGHWVLPIGLSVLFAFGTVPPAFAQGDEGEWEQPGSWVITKIQGEGKYTSQNKRPGDQNMTGPKDEAWSDESTTAYNGMMAAGKGASENVPNRQSDFCCGWRPRPPTNSR